MGALLVRAVPPTPMMQLPLKVILPFSVAVPLQLVMLEVTPSPLSANCLVKLLVPC